jgi:hypothetical protein
MKMLLLKKTNKLFFDKYAYKVSITTPLATYFRGKDLSQTEKHLNLLGQKFDLNPNSKVRIGHSWSKKYASVGDIMIAAKLIDQLKLLNEYTLRVEGSILGIYSNNETITETIPSINNIDVREISKPEDDLSKELLLSRPKVIIRKEYTHKYKVTLKPMYGDEEQFRLWSAKIPKVKVNTGTYKYGGYFYVADAKTLSICRLYLGNKVAKVEEIVSRNEI